MQAAHEAAAQLAPQLVNMIGAGAKHTFNAAADHLEQQPSARDYAPVAQQCSDSDDEEAGGDDDEAGGDDDASTQPNKFWTHNFGANGKMTKIAEAVPVVGQLLAGAHLLTGNKPEAKRALAKSTKSTVMGSVAAGAAVTGGALLGAAAGLGTVATAVGLYGGAVAGAAAGELAGGASQALVEAAVYDDVDRTQIGTEYLSRTPQQWGAGVAVASTVGAVGASVGLHVDHSVFSGRIEQKVAAELTETVASRGLEHVAPGLRRMSSSKRRRESLEADVAEGASPMMVDGGAAPPAAVCDSEPPLLRRLRSRS